ncbi:ferritin light chain-like [Myotis yumanensis]|uniref:ferritin light chain-like n=1 Tax=Myotis yumanensis TaxID=159337 RepID=UPI0038D4D9DA
MSSQIRQNHPTQRRLPSAPAPRICGLTYLSLGLCSRDQVAMGGAAASSEQEQEGSQRLSKSKQPGSVRSPSARSLPAEPLPGEQVELTKKMGDTCLPPQAAAQAGLGEELFHRLTLQHD